MKWWHRLIHGPLMHRRITTLDNYEFTECWCGKAWMEPSPIIKGDW